MKFVDLACSGSPSSSREHQAHYVHEHLTVLVDPLSPKWSDLHCSPKRTPAGQREIKDISTKKLNKQVAGKLKLGAKPEIGLEGTLGWDNSTGNERVRFTSAITQMNMKGVFTWGFEVNDEREKLLVFS